LAKGHRRQSGEGERGDHFLHQKLLGHPYDRARFVAQKKKKKNINIENFSSFSSSSQEVLKKFSGSSQTRFNKTSEAAGSEELILN